MTQSIATITLVVNDYDEALTYYCDVLGFSVIEDTPLNETDAMGRAKRWVVVAPSDSSCTLLLARAANDEQATRVGNQTGGRVSFFLKTDDFKRDYQLYRSRGVEFMEQEPRVTPYGTVIVFRDALGNLWDLIEHSH